MQIKDKWTHPFGNGYQNRNQVEAYLRAIFIATDNDDGLGLQELFDELTLEQYNYIWFLLASHTRRKIKDLTGTTGGAEEGGAGQE